MEITHCVMWLQAESNMKKYGKILMSEVPQKTTQLLKRLCTDYRPFNREWRRTHTQHTHTHTHTYTRTAPSTVSGAGTHAHTHTHTHTHTNRPFYREWSGHAHTTHTHTHTHTHTNAHTAPMSRAHTRTHEPPQQLSRAGTHACASARFCILAQKVMSHGVQDWQNLTTTKPEADTENDRASAGH